MDSEHRHALGENWLADKLAVGVEAVKPQLPLILLVVLAAAVGSFAMSSWRNSSDTIEENAWQSYSLAVNSPTGIPSLPMLEKVSEENPDTSVVAWADVTWADGQLANAVALGLHNRGRANDFLDGAQAKYEELVQLGGTPDRIRSRAQLGLARIQEMRGEVDAAIELYGRVEGAFREIAEARGEELQDDRVRDDVIWLAQAKSVTGRPPLGGAPAPRPGADPAPIDLPSDDVSADQAFDELLRSLESNAEEDGPADQEAPVDQEAPADESESAEGEESVEGGEDTGSDAAEETPTQDDAAPEETPAAADAEE